MVLSTTTSVAAQDLGAFSNQTVAAGIDATSGISDIYPVLGGGSVGDFDGDGWQDIYFPAGGNGPDKLYINNQDGTFTDRATDWGIDFVHYSSAGVVGDYNGDGQLDLFVTSFGPVGDPQVGHHKLLMNMGGSMQNMAPAAGVSQGSSVQADGWGGAWGDYDLDGDLDLAIVGFFDTSGNRLFRNNGDGSFTDVTDSAGLANLTAVRGYTVRFIDMNDDRHPDMIWIGDFSTSQYYVNNGDGSFTEFTDGSGTSMDDSEMGMTVADWNLDGRFDFYVTTIGTNNLYINQGGHIFSNQGDQTNSDVGGFGWGAVAFDLNHDALVDIVSVAEIGRNYVFLNRYDNGVLLFEEVAEANGLGIQSDGRGIANFDYDNDGDQDIIIFPGSGSPVTLMRNDLNEPSRHWLRVFLDNSDHPQIAPNGIGSKVIVQTASGLLLGRIDGGSNYLSQSEMSAHFGLGGAAEVERVRVEWSNGFVSQHGPFPANQTITLALPPDQILADSF